MAWSRVEGEGNEGNDDESDESENGGGVENEEEDESELEKEASSFRGCPSLYLLADCPATNALYVAFRGTKVQSDFLVLADVVPQSPPWPVEKGGRLQLPPLPQLPQPPPPLSEEEGKQQQQQRRKQQQQRRKQQQQPRFSAHRGFARRAAGIPIEEIAAHAASKGRRLVVRKRKREREFGVFFFLSRFFLLILFVSKILQSLFF